MPNLITKSDFVRFLKCPRYSWLYKNRPDLRYKEQSRFAAQGGDVEKLAHRHFNNGEEVTWDKALMEETMRLVADPRTKVIYQASVETDKYFCRADILTRDPDGLGWHLHEIKSSTKEKPEHIRDLCFQAAVFEEVKIPIYSYKLILINKEYTFDQQIGLNTEEFFQIKDLTEKVRKNLPKNQIAMLEANNTLTSAIEPHPKILLTKLPFNPPSAFQEYYWQGIPEYSIYDIARISKKSLGNLVNQNIIHIEDIPEGFFKNSYQNLQVEVTKNKTPFINKAEITETIGKLQYPLYFLDYETINPAIPRYNSTHPYQHICFQYSLHIQRTPDSALEHYEFLHLENDDPRPHLLKKLQSEIGDQGTVLVWFERFEKDRNKEMAADFPAYSQFLENINSRLYDLMKTVDDGLYEDYRFKGKCSIKDILPVLIPELSYKNLAISNGTEAGTAWLNLMENKVEDRDKTIKDMLFYCGQDTLAIVKILEFLKML